MQPAMRGSPRAMPPAAEQEPRLLRRSPARADPPTGAPWRGDRTAAGPSGRDRMAMSGGARSWMCCAGTVLARRHDIRQGPGPDHAPGCRAETPPDARACVGSRLRARTEGSLIAVSQRAPGRPPRHPAGAPLAADSAHPGGFGGSQAGRADGHTGTETRPGPAPAKTRRGAGRSKPARVGFRPARRGASGCRNECKVIGTHPAAPGLGGPTVGATYRRDT